MKEFLKRGQSILIVIMVIAVLCLIICCVMECFDFVNDSSAHLAFPGWLLALLKWKKKRIKGNQPEEKEVIKYASDQDNEDLTEETWACLNDLFQDLSDNKYDEFIYDKILSGISNKMEAVQSLMYVNSEGKLKLKASYAYIIDDTSKREFEFGEGFIGEVANRGKVMAIEHVPSGYLQPFSGLGNSDPSSIILIPLVDDNNTKAVIELALFKKPDSSLLQLAEDMSLQLGKVIPENQENSQLCETI